MITVDFFEVIKSRRSIRRFLPEPIPENVMNQILDIGLLAPNSSNLQSWQFFRVNGKTQPHVRAKINEAFLNQPAATTAAEIVVAVARTNTWRENAKDLIAEIEKTQGQVPAALTTYYKKIVPLVYTVGPFGILGFFKRFILFGRGLFQSTPRECTSKSELRVWAVKTTALACENIMLAARGFGFDSCPMEGLDSSRLRRALKLPSDAVIVMGIAIGRRAPEGLFGPQIRLNRDRFISQVN